MRDTFNRAAESKSLTSKSPFCPFFNFEASPVLVLPVLEMSRPQEQEEGGEEGNEEDGKVGNASSGEVREGEEGEGGEKQDGSKDGSKKEIATDFEATSNASKKDATTISKAMGIFTLVHQLHLSQKSVNQW